MGRIATRAYTQRRSRAEVWVRASGPPLVPAPPILVACTARNWRLEHVIEQGAVSRIR